MPIEFLEPGLGSDPTGQESPQGHRLDRGWCYADPNTRRGGSPTPETARQGTQRQVQTLPAPLLFHGSRTAQVLDPVYQLVEAAKML